MLAREAWLWETRFVLVEHKAVTSACVKTISPSFCVSVFVFSFSINFVHSFRHWSLVFIPFRFCFILAFSRVMGKPF